MRKKLIFGIIAIATLAVLLSGCFLMPKPSLTAGNYYLVTSFNDWSENPAVLKDYTFKNNELTIDTSAHATFLYYVIKAQSNGSVERYGSKDVPVFAFGSSNSTFYVHPGMLKAGEIVGIGDNTKNDKDFWFHGAVGNATWKKPVKMQRMSGSATLTYTATEVPMGNIDFKLTVAASSWVDPQTFNGHWNGVGNNLEFKLSEDASELTIKFNPLTDLATMSYIKSKVPLTPEYYAVGSFNGWKKDKGLIQLTDSDGDGVFTAATSTTTKFSTTTNGVVEYKVIKKYKTTINWFGAGNHFFSATPTTANFYMTLDSNKDPKTYGTDINTMSNLPLAVAGDFNGWNDTLMKIVDSTYQATLSGNFQAKDYGLKIKKPGTWDSYKYPDSNYTATLSDSASEIKITFDPKTWEITLTKVK